MLPCDFKGPPTRKLDCHCGGVRTAYQCKCPAKVSRECVELPLSYKAVEMFGPVPACGECLDRQVGGIPRPPSSPSMAGDTALANRSLPRSELHWAFDIPRASIAAGVSEECPSICEFQGRRLMTYLSRGDGTMFFLASLDAACEAQTVFPIRLPICDQNAAGIESGRLVANGSDLLLMYTGRCFRGDQTSMLARITVHGEVLQHSPIYWPNGRRDQVNWNFFSHNGRVLATTGLNPHENLLLTCLNAESHKSARWDCSYPFGEILNGAPPVKHGNLWYSWFAAKGLVGLAQVVSVGVLCFEDREPFKVVKCCHRPLYSPIESERTVPSDPLNTWPFGAICATNRWIVSLSAYGRSLRIISIDADVVERELVSVGG